jgi:hypothetical protein
MLARQEDEKRGSGRAQDLVQPDLPRSECHHYQSVSREELGSADDHEDEDEAEYQPAISRLMPNGTTPSDPASTVMARGPKADKRAARMPRNSCEPSRHR